MNLIQKVKSIHDHIFDSEGSKKALIIGSKNNFEIESFKELGFLIDVVEPNDEGITIKSENVVIYSEKIEDFVSHSEKTYDCIFAQNVFYFVQNQREIIKILSGKLKSGGIFCFSVMGEKDDWVTKEGINYLNKQELDELKKDLSNEYKLIFLTEECGLGNTMAGKIKNWHIYGFIFQKNK